MTPEAFAQSIEAEPAGVVFGGGFPTSSYRYALWRSGLSGVLLTDQPRPRTGPIAFVMLNPSTADAQRLDPTLTRCRSFALQLDFDSLVVANLFAWRTPFPRLLTRARTNGQDIVGAENDAWIARVLDVAELVICAWGADPIAADRVVALGTLWARYLPKLWCLGTTAAGDPRHPLFVTGGTVPQPWPLEIQRCKS